jgi:hypothetical protein
VIAGGFWFVLFVCVAGASAEAQAQDSTTHRLVAGCWLGQIDVPGIAGNLTITSDTSFVLQLRRDARHDVQMNDYHGSFQQKGDTLMLNVRQRERYYRTGKRRALDTIAQPTLHLVQAGPILHGTLVLEEVAYPTTFYEGCD